MWEKNKILVLVIKLLMWKKNHVILRNFSAKKESLSGLAGAGYASIFADSMQKQVF